MAKKEIEKQKKDPVHPQDIGNTQMACNYDCVEGFILRMKISTGKITTYVCPCPKGDRHRAYFTKSNERSKYGKKAPTVPRPIQKEVDQKLKQFKDGDE